MDRFQETIDLSTTLLSALSLDSFPWWAWLAFAGVGLIVMRAIIRMLRRKKKAKPVAEVLLEDDGVFGAWTDALASQIPESKKGSKDFAQMVRQAGMYSPRATASLYALRFVLLFVPLSVAGLFALTSPTEMTYPILIGGAVIAAGLSIVPRLYVFFRRRNRQQEIREGLADMMDMLSMCLGGGMPLAESLEHVASNLETCPSLAEELRILKRQADVSCLKVALADMSRRIDMPEVRQVVGLLSRGDRLGTRMSDSLHEHSDHFRTQRRQWATSQANKTPVKLVLPLMFCFAPAALILLISPAMMELQDFLYPTDGSPSVLTGNESLATGQIISTLDELDQTIPQTP